MSRLKALLSATTASQEEAEGRARGADEEVKRLRRALTEASQQYLDLERKVRAGAGVRADERREACACRVIYAAEKCREAWSERLSRPAHRRGMQSMTGKTGRRRCVACTRSGRPWPRERSPRHARSARSCGRASSMP